MRLATIGGFGLLAFLSVMNLETEQGVGRAVADTLTASRCRSSASLVETIKHYDFFGAQQTDADRSFRQKLLVSQDFAGTTKQFAGQADWYVDWTPCLEPRGAGCRVGGVTSVAHVTYTLPRWADRNFAHAPLQGKWDRYATNLLAHEKGHGAIALKVASMIESELVGLTDEANCDEVRNEAARRVDNMIRRGETMQNEYDRSTEHGFRQGAVFPF